MQKISVIIPTYNGEKVIGRAIKSILNQEGNFDFEILICDDCSTDLTVKIAKELGATVLVNSRHTSGPNAGRNNGIKKATGDYIAFLDQDDEWLPNKIKVQMKKVEGYDVISSGKIIVHR